MIKSFGTIIVIAAVIAACSTITPEQKKKAEEHGRKCIEQLGIKSEDVRKLIDGDLSITDPNIKCFGKCFFQEIGIMDAEGEFLDAVAIEKLSADQEKKKVVALVNTCKLQIGSDPCDTAFNIYKCYVSHKAL